MASNHPLPTSPGQQKPGRERAKSSFSFHSHKSSGSNNKIDLHETHQEKDSKRIHSKADPSMALAEAEPSAVANSVQTSLLPIRSIQHRDAQGNPIADPDRSNPTRSRWERPLDTIRAFEAAIDGNYSRKSDIQTDSADTASVYNRRSSYYGGTQVTQNERPQYPQNSYYGRSQSYRPESTYNDRHNGVARSESHYNGGDNATGPSNGYHPNRARYPRTASEPHFNNGQGGVYPAPGNQPSYETVTTASGSGGSSADPAGYMTDPSSENSSMDRVAPLPHKDVETYGFNGFGNTPQYASPGSGLDQRQGPTGAARQGNGYQHQGPPPPSKEGIAPRAPIKLGESNGNATPQPAEIPAAANEKRKSWFGRKFGK
ncbi:Uncharacterized protein LHYA1_G002606 [Lachnellula hyalina]|uniref:Uncharacterized protein n=1 Tax=Lachnellula hyalina TaxID=1316788 RepID=A0A8H8R772_9HELO|nr:Uncharacterized protein LHYA1_G002606 [Lachnellula hyalina]TVY28084.1 Uncharacterized protein LHYA1_G002606 [Lachnellula hyalina]